MGPSPRPMRRPWDPGADAVMTTSSPSLLPQEICSTSNVPPSASRTASVMNVRVARLSRESGCHTRSTATGGRTGYPMSLTTTAFPSYVTLALGRCSSSVQPRPRPTKERAVS